MVAALVATSTVDEHTLHLFDSKIHKWSCRAVFVTEPQREFPVDIPYYSGRIHHHVTTTVITVGGERGTMGWVDLWRGILLCDAIDENPSLRGVPLPLPIKEMSYNDGMGTKLGSPSQRRGIAFVRDSSRLKFVHLEVRDVRLRARAGKTGLAPPCFRTDSWVLTTWTNTNMSTAFEDWHQDYCEVEVSDIAIDDPAVSQALESVLLLRSNGDGVEELALQNLSISQPAPSVNKDHLVFLVARQQFMDPQAWILAVDVKNRKLEAVVELGEQRHYGAVVIYFPSKIYRNLDHVEYNQATTPGNRLLYLLLQAPVPLSPICLAFD